MEKEDFRSRQDVGLEETEDKKLIEILRMTRGFIEDIEFEDYLSNCKDSLGKNSSFQLFLQNMIHLVQVQLKGNKSILLYHGVGTGKTQFTLSILKEKFTQQEFQQKILIVGQVDILHVWRKEIAAFQRHREFSFSNIKYQDVDQWENFSGEQDLIIVFDEFHNFIRKILKVKQQQKKVNPKIESYQKIYQQIQEVNPQIIALSATPITQDSFELGLIMNLFRPGIFPEDYKQFHDYVRGMNPYNLKRLIFPYVSYLKLGSQFLFRVKKSFLEVSGMSEKLNLLVKFAQEHQEKIIVFLSKVEANQIADFMEKGKVKYAFFTGVGQSDKQRQEVLRSFNGSDNLFGEKIQVLFLTKIGKEGISISNSRFVFFLDIFSPFFQKQMIGRINRLCSLYQLLKANPEMEQMIQVFYLFSPSQRELYKKKQEEEQVIKEMNRILKTSAVGCFYNSRGAEGLECFTLPLEQFVGPKKNIPAFIFELSTLSEKNEQIPIYQKQEFTKVICQTREDFQRNVARFFPVLVNKDFYAYHFKYRFFLGRLYLRDSVPFFYKSGDRFIFIMQNYY